MAVMSSPSAEKPLVLYHYLVSPYSKKIRWYLALRGISYKQCIQPMIMPRPDVALLGVKYRRIPILTIGRDVYLDTRLIVRKLEELDAEKPRLSAETPEQRAIERLLGSFIMESGFSKNVLILMMLNAPQLKNEAFSKDRADMIGSDKFFPPEVVASLGPDAINEVRAGFQFLETTLLADGREWILNTEKPKIADIEAIWPFYLMASVPGALPPKQISAKLFPKVFAWIDRFQQAVDDAEQLLGEAENLSGVEAAKTVFSSGYHEDEKYIDETDILVQKQGLKKGQLVQVWPTDTGSRHKELAELVSLDNEEIVIESKTGSNSVRIHAQRHGFAVKAYDE